MALSAPAQAEGRPFTVDDLLALESLGDVRLSPDSRFLVIERAGPYDATERFEHDYYTRLAITDLEVRDRAGALLHTLRSNGSQGYDSGPFSPDGRHMAVFRLSPGPRWQLGVLVLETGQVTWLDVTPDQSLVGRSVGWRGADELVFLARERGDLPIVLRMGWQTQARTAERWRRQQEGREPTVTALFSGPARDRRPQAAPSRLMSYRLDTAALRTWATGEFVDVALSPDGARAAVLENTTDLQPIPQGPAEIGTPNRRRELRLVDLETGRLGSPLPDRDLASHLLSWAPDSSDLLVFDRAPGAPFDTGRLTRVGRNGSAAPLPMRDVRPVVLETLEAIPFVRVAWLDDRPLVWSRDGEGRATWRRVEPNGAAVDLGLPADPSARWISDEPGLLFVSGDRLHRVTRAGVTPAGSGQVLFGSTSLDQGGRGARNPDTASSILGAVLRPDGRQSAPLAVEAGDPLLPNETPLVADAAGLITRRTDERGVTELVLRGPGTAVPLLTLNAGLAGIAWGRLTSVDHPGYDGRPLKSWVLEPRGPRPPDGWPVVVTIYPRSVFPDPPARALPGSAAHQVSPAVLAAQGYAVLFASLPTHEETPGPGLEALGSEVWAIVEAAAAAGLVDPSRAALFGHSYGGHGALLVATQTDRFRTVIASAGAADYGTFSRATRHFAAVPEDGYLLGRAGWLEGGQGRMGGPAWSDPAAYVANSPLYLVDRIRTPIMLIEGELDPVGADPMFAGLYQRGVEAAYLHFWGEEHILASPANIRALHDHVLAWLDRHLDEEPATIERAAGRASEGGNGSAGQS
ncbi:alpha/beta hydrolase family protein [Brevundimonas staleyi]|uniref:Alpha/beta hydrolase family protein n=1 Tax=Brevundimonas staleyi TaxID=74326 RepID=A0ABW0FWQ0_9CAUL